MKLEGIEDLSILAICKNGILIKRSWIPPERDDESDEIIQDGYYEDTDITEDLPIYLYEPCIFQEGLTLRDLFKLCDKHKDFLAKLQYRNFFLQYLELGLNAPPTKDPSIPERCKKYPGRWAGYIFSTFMSIEQEYIYEEDSYLNMGSLSADGSIGEDKKWLVHEKGEHRTDSMGFYHDFAGYSLPLTQEDLDELEYPEGHALGEIVRYGGLNNCLEKNMDLPLKLNKTIRVEEYVENRWKYYDVKRNFQYKLGEIIHEIFYEISYNGLPEDSEAFFEELEEIANQADEAFKRK